MKSNVQHLPEPVKKELIAASAKYIGYLMIPSQCFLILVFGLVLHANTQTPNPGFPGWVLWAGLGVLLLALIAIVFFMLRNLRILREKGESHSSSGAHEQTRLVF